MNGRIEAVISAMISYNKGDPARIGHALKVYGFAKAIAAEEGLSEETRRLVETAAVLHDIGIHESERKYGDASGAHQQVEGPPVAREILSSLGFDAGAIDRVCWLIAHHHTYTGVTQPDHRVLIEADFLVNTEEDPVMRRSAGRIYAEQMKTKTGRAFYRSLFPEAAPED